jgi:predicted ATPase
VQRGDVELYLKNKGIQFVRRYASGEMVYHCPWCPDEGKDPALKVHEDDGKFHCWRCDRKGGFMALKEALGDFREIRRAVVPSAPARPKVEPKATPALERSLAEAEAELWASMGKPGLKYLHERGFTDEMIRCFRFGFNQTFRFNESAIEPAIVIPFLRDGKPVLLKRRNLAPPDTKKQIHREPVGSFHPLYNADALREAAGGTVYVAEGELDAVSLEQMGFTPAVSGDNGAGYWDDSWAEALLDFDRVLVCYDADPDGEKGFEKVAKALGGYRVARLKMPRGAKDANAALRSGVPLSEIRDAVDAAESPMRSLVLTYREALNAATADMTQKILGSVGWKHFDRALGGLRPAELSIFCGEPGCGKTTLLSDFVRRQAVNGNAVLFGSFENRPEEIAEDIALAQQDAAHESPEGAAGAVALERGLIFIRASGKMAIETLRDVTLYAVRRFGVRVVILDNLHAFLPYDSSNERFEIDRAVDTIDRLTKEYAIHTVLVVHLRKRPQGMGKAERDLNDLLGSIGPGRVASNVFLVERREHCLTRLSFLKARSKYATQGAKLLFRYNAATRRFSEAQPEDEKISGRPRNAFDRRKVAAGEGDSDD